MQFIRKNGATSNTFRVTLRDSTTGQGKTGLTSASSGLIISTICDNEATATTYTAAGSTIETITTLGTFAMPTATKCRFKEVDATNHPGSYEIQLADVRFAVSSAKILRVTITVTGVISKDIVIQLTTADVDTAAMGALMPATAGRTLVVDASGLADANAVKIGPTGAGAAQTARDIGASVLLSSGSGAGQLDFTSGVVKSNLAQILGTALTETAGQLAAAFKKFFNIATPASTMDALTLVSTATNLTNAPTAGDFTATMKTSIGTAVASSAVASVTGNVGGNVVGSVGSVTAAVTLPTIPTDWITANGMAASADSEIAAAVWDLATTGHTTSGTFGAAMNAAGSAGDPWATSLPGAYGAGTAGSILGTNLNAAITSRQATITFPTNFAALGISAGGHISNVDTLTTYTGDTPQSGDAYARIGAAGAGLTALGDTRLAHLDADISSRAASFSTVTLAASQPNYAPSKAGDAMTLTSAYDFAKGTVAVTESYAADGAAPTPVQSLMLVQQMLTEITISGTTMTVKKLDGATTAATLTLNDGTTPTSITRAS